MKSIYSRKWILEYRILEFQRMSANCKPRMSFTGCVENGSMEGVLVGVGIEIGRMTEKSWKEREVVIAHHHEKPLDFHSYKSIIR
jgi:hypothetical protein